jgi:hypothetical protein
MNNNYDLSVARKKANTDDLKPLQFASQITSDIT